MGLASGGFGLASGGLGPVGCTKVLENFCFRYGNRDFRGLLCVGLASGGLGLASGGLGPVGCTKVLENLCFCHGNGDFRGLWCVGLAIIFGTISEPLGHEMVNANLCKVFVLCFRYFLGSRAGSKP